MATKRRNSSYKKGKGSRRRQKSSATGWAWYLLGGTVLFISVMILLTQLGGNEQADVGLADPAVLAQGKTIFNDTCAVCHGINGEGNVGPALNGSMHAWHHGDEQLRAVIRDGVPGTEMPAHADQLTPTEINAVITYFQAWWTPAQRATQQTR